MKPNLKTSFAIALAISLTGCSHNAALRQEIATIETRLGAVENEIAQGTAEIGAPGKDVRTRVAYRPLQQWAASFGTKTATFRQNDRAGDIAREGPTCRLHGFPPRWDKEPGYRVWIHEDKSTKVDFTLGPLNFIPTDQGLQFSSKIDLWLKTQIAGAGRPPCVGGWSPTITAGAEGRARPTTILELKLSQSDNLRPRYDLAVISPKKLDVEFRTGIQLPFFGDVDIKRTFQIDNFARQLASGEFDLLVEKSGEILLPGGEARAYRLATIDPAIRLDRNGVMLETDIDLQREPQ